MPYKDPNKQREVMRTIMQKRTQEIKKQLEKFYLNIANYEAGKPFYTWIARNKEGKIVEQGFTSDDLSTLEKLEAWQLKGYKQGISPHEVWYCYPIWLPEETSNVEQKPTEEAEQKVYNTEAKQVT